MVDKITLYCPKCDDMIVFDAKGELSNSCPACGISSGALWPNKQMYERHIAFEQRALDEAAAKKKADDERAEANHMQIEPTHVAMVEPVDENLTVDEAPDDDDSGDDVVGDEGDKPKKARKKKEA